MKTILYVDDEVSLGLVVSRFFERRGDRVHVARSVAEAREVLEREEPTIIFIDMWLGTESGFELMSWIDDTRPHMADTVTFVTGAVVDPNSTEMMFKTLGRPVIRKPFDITRIIEAVDDAEKRVGA
ncbi:MAG: sigma-54-dependent transcriptional response regulator [Gemmatimonadetes bacterium]|nr:sigma-54-dependent transcriptional response regulator [Gemmatimonadota bacterium]